MIEFIEATGLLAKRRKLLEVGSGEGYMLRYLTNQGHDVCGIDMDPTVIAECDPGLTIHNRSRPICPSTRARSISS